MKKKSKVRMIFFVIAASVLSACVFPGEGDEGYRRDRREYDEHHWDHHDDREYRPYYQDRENQYR